MTCFLKPGSCGDAKFLIWVSGWISLRLPDLYKKIFRFLCRPCSTTVYPSMHWAKREEWKTFQLEQGVPDLFLQSNIFRLYLRGKEVSDGMDKNNQILNVSQSFFPIGCARKSSRKKKSRATPIIFPEPIHLIPFIQRSSGTTLSSLYLSGSFSRFSFYHDFSPYYSFRKLNRLSISCKQNSVIGKD